MSGLLSYPLSYFSPSFCHCLYLYIRKRTEKSRENVFVCRQVCVCAQYVHHLVCVLEHLNHRAEIRFNYTCNNFKVSMGRETICMLISMTVVMTCNKSNICCMIKSDIRALPQSVFAIHPESTC